MIPDDIIFDDICELPPLAEPSTPNLDLLNKVLDKIEHIEAFKEQGLDLEEDWDQGSWAIQRFDEDENVCGTAMCFAGHAVVEAGHKLVWKPIESECSCLDCLEETHPVTECHVDDGRDIETAAREVLGLSSMQSQMLFSGSNQLKDLRRIVGQLNAGEEMSWEVPTLVIPMTIFDEAAG